MIYVILRKTTDHEYGYGGWTGKTIDRTEIMGYVTSEEKAVDRVMLLQKQEEKDRQKHRRHCPPFDYEWESVAEIE